MMQAFKALPHDLMAKLCKGMQLQHVPQNGVVVEEDEAGDSMYVVMSGACTVRALPPPTKPGKVPEGDHGSVAVSTIAALPATKQKRRVQLAPEEQVCAAIVIFRVLS